MKNSTDWVLVRRALNLAQEADLFQTCNCTDAARQYKELQCEHCQLAEAQKALTRVMILTMFPCGPSSWQSLPPAMRAAVIRAQAEMAQTEAQRCAVWILRMVEAAKRLPAPREVAERAQAEGFDDATIGEAMDELAWLIG